MLVHYPVPHSLVNSEPLIPNRDFNIRFRLVNWVI